jgi:hypothetical protein
MKIDPQIIALASGVFLCEELPIDLIEEDDEDKLIEFIRDNKWEPFEYAQRPSETILKDIYDHAESIQRFGNSAVNGRPAGEPILYDLVKETRDEIKKISSHITKGNKSNG